MAASPDGIALDMRRTFSAPTLLPLPRPRGFEHLLSESVQRAVALTMTAPFEVIKTRSQVGLLPRSFGFRFNGNFSSFLILYPTLIARSATTKLFHDALRDENGNGKKEQMDVRLKLLSQYVGGIAGNVLSNPLEVIAARSIAGRPYISPKLKYNGVFPTLLHLARTEGFAGMSRGLVARCMGTVLSDCVLSICNDFIDEWESKYLSENVTNNYFYPIFREVVASLITATVVYPLDTIKRIIQVDSELYMNTGRHWVGEMFLAPFRCLRDVIEHRGVLALWQGNGYNLVKVSLHAVVIFCVGEATRKYWEHRNRPRSYWDILGFTGLSAAALYSLYRFGICE